MKWAIDRIIDNIVIIENIETGELKEVNIKILPFSIQEGTILIYKNNKYELNKTFEDKRRQMIEERFKRLRNKN